jgi:hypothetical protein
MVLRAYADCRKTTRDPILIVSEATGLPYRQVWIHVSGKRRFSKWIDYGVALHCGWLSPAGYAELARLEAPNERAP